MTKWQSKDINFGETDVSYVLGLCFNIQEDIFLFKGFQFNDIPLKFTKRLLLSIIAKLYDPLGYLAPFIMKGKIMLQKLWRQGLEWDTIIDDSDADQFVLWIESSKALKDWKLIRPYFSDHWSSIQQLEIHAFSDASQDGYGAVVYFRIKADTGWKTVFVAAKSRAAPIQRVTIPRMEVLSCLLAVRLVTSIIFYLDLKSSNFKKTILV